MYPRQALKQLQKIGTCAHSEFPVNYNYENSCAALAKLNNLEQITHFAKLRSIKAYYKIYTLNEIKYTLMNVGPILISVPAFGKPYWNGNGDGVLMMGPKSAKTGAHAMVIVGWKDNTTLIIQNSWGALWGDHGYAYLDFETYEINEMWAITDQLTAEIQHYWNCKAGVHAFTDWVIDKEPTCILNGQTSRKCIYCGLEEAKTILNTNIHNFTEWECTNSKTGLYKRKCQNQYCVKTEYQYHEPQRPSIWATIVNFFKGLLEILFKKDGDKQ